MNDRTTDAVASWICFDADLQVTDGVSLESGKVEHRVLAGMGVECFYITGQSDRPAARTALIEEAHFQLSAEIKEITD